MDAAGDDIVAADPVAERDAADGDFVAGSDGLDDFGALYFGDGLLRDKERVFGDGSGEPDAAELSRTHDGLRVGELGYETEGPGLHVHGAVGNDESTFVRKDRAIGHDQLEVGGAAAQLALGFQPLV